MLSEQTLYQRAQQVRDYLSSNCSGHHLNLLKRFPVGCCKAGSLLLLQWLVDREGATNIYGLANGSRPNHITPDENASHFWLEQNHLIIDITMDQFHDSEADVFVSSDRTWHNTFEGSKRFHQACLLPLNELYFHEYRTMCESF